jgi:hypothetical protein
MAPASDLDRRAFLGGAALFLFAPWRALAEEGRPHPRIALVKEAEKLFETSPYVYVSPLKRDGAESTCHGEVWYAWLDGAVVVNSRRGTWKVKALEQGLDRARIWVGDYGRWKPVVGSSRNEAFREGPSFDAKASFVTDRSVLDRFIASSEKKYAGEFARWKEDMQTGFFSGQRRLIRYEPA